MTAIVAEATHYFRSKPRSRAFFETMRDAPEQLGERVAPRSSASMAARWRSLIQMNGDAWIRIADEASSDDADLYGGRLAETRSARAARARRKGSADRAGRVRGDAFRS